jgi:hypothetical protein
MQHSRLLAFVFAFFAFAMVAFAGPVAKSGVTDLVARTTDQDKVDAILDIVVKLKADIKVILDLIG